MPNVRSAGTALAAVSAVAIAGVGAAAVRDEAPAGPAPVRAAPAAAPAAPVAPAAPAAPTVSWGRCASAELRAAGAQCGKLSVPLDHDKPSGSRITVAVSRIKATAPPGERQGPLLVNPGGPGGKGLAYSARMRNRLPASIARTYDLIGFDPRGVGASRPAMSCIEDYARGPRPDYEPTTGATEPISTPEKQWLARSKKYAEACASNTPYLIKRMRTVDAVRDIELLRRALGARKINFYGYSYGTYLAQVYATRYPDRVRRLVLDGVVDPRWVWYTAQLNQDKGFERAIGAFFAWTAKHNSTYRLGDTASKVAARFYAEQDELRDNPRAGIGPAEWTDVFLPGGYAQGWWPTLATALRQWRNGDTRLAAAIYADRAEIGDDNGFAVYNAVQCTDAVWPRDYATWRRDAFATAAVAPFETWGNVWYNTPCIYWKAPQGVPVAIRTQRVRALIVSTSLDAATPYAGALELRKRWTRSVLVGEIGNTTHTAGLDGYRCVDSRILAYLRTGKLPDRVSGTRADVRCPARPQPTP